MRNFYSISSLNHRFVPRRVSNKYLINAIRPYSKEVSSPKPPGLLLHYRNLVEQGRLQHDPFQEKVALALENLIGRLEQYEKDMVEYHIKLAEWEKHRENEHRRLLTEEAELKQCGDLWTSVSKRRSRLLERWVFRRKSEDIEPGVGKWVSYLNREKKLDSLVGRRPTAPSAPKGLYIYGNVGIGKTMLMDMFYSATDGIVKHRQRFHFHETVDVFAIVALSGILSRLLTTGTVLVATSNRAPKDLNQDGMQREIFLNFVDKLEEHCEIILIGSEIDYRRLIAQRSIDKVHYFWPLDGTALKEFEKIWCQVINEVGGKVTCNTVPVMFGRTLEVPESCNGVARFTFEHLCGRPVGAADYIAVAKNHHTVFIADIPVMSMRIRDKARRFITLIDELYNHHCRLFCSAATSIDDLFQGTEEGTLFDLESFQFETETEGAKLRRNVLAEGSVSSGGAPAGITSMLSGQEEMFAFRRAVSRLIEMQTPLYLEGVRFLHPYFQRELQNFGNYSVSNVQHQVSS
ncbi:AFG1-like ATPase isoform X2 [Durio zibethinus]|uniref:AFG1-like ATPase isoform X2 n=1 Tax=Durio zibethinus TaxID=66656 RepID=A0A6P5ZBP2_DURZI|nr:AFG1-like ATPase isoform X2 [Durio zibethinus]